MKIIVVLSSRLVCKPDGLLYVKEVEPCLTHVKNYMCVCYLSLSYLHYLKIYLGNLDVKVSLSR